MASAAIDASDKPARTGGRWFTLIVVSLAVGGIFAVFVIWAFGGVYGTEFDPVTTDQRSFIYYQVPWIHIPLTPVFRDKQKTPLGRYLILKGHWSGRGKSRWDLVGVYGPGSSGEADAAVLLTFMETSDRGNKLYWKEWTKDHPKEAKLLWPAVEALARESLYPYVTVLFESARIADDVTAYQEFVKQRLAPLIKRDLEIAERQSNGDRAARLRRAAAKLWPDETQWAPQSRPTSDSIGKNE